MLSAKALYFVRRVRAQVRNKYDSSETDCMFHPVSLDITVLKDEKSWETMEDTRHGLWYGIKNIEAKLYRQHGNQELFLMTLC